MTEPIQCGSCPEDTTSPIYDPEQMLWLGTRGATPFCSTECLDNCAEQQQQERAIERHAA